MLLAEELLLLCTDDDSGMGIVGTASMDRALAMALVFEMSILGLTASGPDQSALRRTGEASSDDPLLDLAVDKVIGHDPVDGVRELQTAPLRKAVVTRLTTRGTLREDSWWSRGVHPQQDPQPELALRGRLRDILLEGREPRAHDVALIALLDHLGVVAKVFPHEDSAGVVKAAHQASMHWEDIDVFRAGKAGRATRGRFADAMDILEIITVPFRLLDGL